MSNPAAKHLHIFRAGKHVTHAGAPMEFSGADVSQIAASYDPAVYRAPFVVGHPKTEDAAYGWADSLTATGEGLFASPAEVEPTFAEMVNSGRFKNISVALWPPGHASNPKPEGYYLKHVGFLGAAAPAVKGLKPAAFAADDEKIVQIEFAEGAADTLLGKLFQMFKSELSTSLQPASFAAPTQENIEMTPAELQAAQTALAAKELAFAEREATAVKTAAAASLTAARASAVEFAERIAKEGKILPTHKPAVIEALTALHTSPAVEFSEGEGANVTKVSKSPADALRAVLDGSKVFVNFSEKSGGDVAEGGPVKASAVPGFSVDANRAAQHELAVQFAEKYKVDYLTAVLRLESGAKL